MLDETILMALTGVAGVLFVLFCYLWLRTKGLAQKQAVEILRLKKETDQMEESIGDLQKQKNATDLFFGTVSHEVRTPMNGILSTAAFLLSTDLKEEQRNCVEQIQESGEGLLLLLDNLLNQARLESGIEMTENRENELSSVWDDLQQSFTALLRRKEISLETYYRGNSKYLVRADPSLLRLFFANLVGLAIRAGQSADLIYLEGGCQNGDSRKFVATLVFYSRDTEANARWREEMQRDPFEASQFENRKRIDLGSLNLSMAQKICRLWGGRMVWNQDGHKIELLLETNLEASKVKDRVAAKRLRSLLRDPLASGSRSLTLLVVEDDPTNRTVAKMILKKMGHEIFLAEDGKRALEMVRATSFDAVLMDIDMPVMDGIEATKRIRAGESGEENKSLPIVTLTAFAVANDREKYLGMGFSGFLTKPIEPSRMRTVLSQVTQA
ncbi:MAG: response regulator [Opitutales bacterium]|nr:response regulator [Opitutales bacterium]MCH8539949.1 response regulator [Opitutales bacterium]